MVKVLWTGGWDSTFRVLQVIYRYEAVVQPYYVIDQHRQSTPVEIATMRNIADRIRSEDPKKGQRLLDLKIVERSSLSEDPSLDAMWSRLSKQGPLGTQYVWLANFMRQYDAWGLELCIHKDDRATRFVVDHAIFRKNANGGYWELPDTVMNSDLELFRGFRFPILTMTKVKMKEAAHEMGFEHLMNMTWFCHSPTKTGEPCGVCGPCGDARIEGMGWRVPKTPLSRILVRRTRRSLGRVKRAILRR